jgi:hypothetical protein
VAVRFANPIGTDLAGVLRAVGVLLVCAWAAGCEQENPRTFDDFMEDALAREGVLARCNLDRTTTDEDAECEAARRAASAVAAEMEQARKGGLERESERKMIAMRDRVAEQDRAAAEVAARAEAERAAAYDAQWRDPTSPRTASAEGVPAPAFGAPLGAFAAAAPQDDPFAEFVPVVPPLEVAAVAPPVSDFQIAEPELEFGEVTSIPRPFRNKEDAAVPH